MNILHPWQLLLVTLAGWINRQQEGVRAVRLRHRSPNLNAYAERFVRTIKEGCLNRRIFFGEHSLWNAINEFLEFYHHERNHQGLVN